MEESEILDRLGDIAEEMLAIAPSDPDDLTPELYEILHGKAMELGLLKDQLE